MAAVPGSLETDKQPPMTIPLAHFVVGLGFLLAGGLVGMASVTGVPVGNASLVHVHLLLAGWVCVTIMGAMTQFVPVWSGVTLHDRRLATTQLWLVVVGLVGFATALLAEWLVLVPLFGGLVAVGFWVFVYNVGRTLATVDSPDETERHFALALLFFVLVTLLGIALAVDFVRPVFAAVPVTRADVVGAHATLAVFGAILTTVLGALYQLGTMFTQTELHGIDVPLGRLEELSYPVGVLGLAIGRLLDAPSLGRAGGLLLAVGVAAMSVVLARRLVETEVPWTPMLSRYAVVAAAMGLWALRAMPAWLGSPPGAGTRFGAPGTVHLLTLGVIGFVVLGTLYHIVPFIVWVHRYSDQLGYGDVPMIDDLYDDRLAAIDFVLLIGGGGLVVLADSVSVPRVVPGVGGVLVLAGTLVFTWNLTSVIRVHSPHGLLDVVLASGRTDQPPGESTPRQ